MKQKPILAILLGDAAGIAPELVAKLLARRYFQQHCRPVLIGDRRVLELGFHQAKQISPYYCVKSVEEIDWAQNSAALLDTADLDPADIQLRKVNAKCGAACISMIRRAVELFQHGKIHGICYAPFNKAAMHLGGNGEGSELELIVRLLGHQGPYGEINMLDNVWTTRVTSHIPVEQICGKLNKESILDSIKLAQKTLFMAGIEAPRIAVCALNPHGGEGGLFGSQEQEMIEPAVYAAREAGLNVSGPFPADTVFHRAFGGEFDGVVTMYHDQGQIAMKIRGFERGITICGGLDLPIATCGHGTAYDIAGEGIAGTGSFENAIAMAAQMARRLQRVSID
ncbi:MAG TPA: 4-hydroxythreonine-4-phosphate dehydrogenase PdxA [Syntrophomonas sp.]|nr:4-hydroxythreonine-4-phosphate dehydrogenase PdxA [Syntrophomonas sp.]